MLSPDLFKRSEVENLDRLASNTNDSGLLPTAQLAINGP